MITTAESGTEAARPRSEAPIGVAELFTIGIGPSSSHTVGPMRAAYRFAEALGPERLPRVERVVVELFGSLALTGKGHATDTAVLLGLLGWEPETVAPDRVPALVEEVRRTGTLRLAGRHPVPFAEAEHLLFRMGEFLPGHPNAVRFSAHLRDGTAFTRQYYCIGGGAIALDGDDARDARPGGNVRQPYPFSSAAELLDIGRRTGLSVAQIVLANEQAWWERSETEAFLDRVRQAMLDCIDRGCRQSGTLPGGLNVRRRAGALYRDLAAAGPGYHPSRVFEWVSLYALAVNEENAAGGRVVTAPTNGAADVIPAGNTMGAVKAINAAYLALRGDGTHVVSLDTVIETMRQTGNDMRSKYKETGLGGLAVNFVEC